MPEFQCSREIVLPAEPEAVWQAVATNAGNTAWLFPTGPDASADGSEAWDPPHHLTVRQEQGDWFNALEFKIEAREGGTSVLRYVHSGIFVEDWDNQYDSLGQHTDFYLHTLSEYLAHFDGRPATYIGDVPGGIMGPQSSATPDGFDRLQGALGLPSTAAEGDAVRLTPEGLAPIVGVVDYRRDNFIGIRTDDALYRLFGRNAFGGPVAIVIHSFADGVDVDAVRGDWQRWLETTFA